VRFFIELLTETPTLGCDNPAPPGDPSIFQNTFQKAVPFNITRVEDYIKGTLYKKYHKPPPSITSELLCLVRNPREVLLAQSKYTYKLDGWDGYDKYFNIIDHFNSFNGKKLILFYEDIIIDRHIFIKKLYNFLDCRNESKLNYVLENIDELFDISKMGKGRTWGGVNSIGISFYYSKINEDLKCKFNEYIESKIQSGKYDILKSKYNL
jgi:hypothetical protein